MVTNVRRVQTAGYGNRIGNERSYAVNREKSRTPQPP